MSARAAKFVIVRTAAGFHVRLVGANGRTVFTTEPYTERRAAARAIEIAHDTTEHVVPPLVDERPGR